MNKLTNLKLNTLTNVKMIWLANKIMLAHSVISLMGIGWAWLVSQLALAILFAILWLGAFIIWMEWKNGG
jgi:hypothetical protein